MSGAIRTVLILGLLASAGLASPVQDPPAAPEKPAVSKSILWNRTWEGALREAQLRNVPIYILVSIGEG